MKEIDLMAELKAELKAKLDQVRADRERSVAVHTEAYAELSQVVARRDELDEQPAVHVADLQAKLAEAESHRDRLNAVVERQAAMLARVTPVVEAARALTESVRPTSNASTTEMLRHLLDAVDTLAAAEPSDSGGESSTGPSIDRSSGNGGGCDHWMHSLALERGASMTFMPEVYEDFLAHRQACPTATNVGASTARSNEPAAHVGTCTVCGRAIDMVITGTGYLWRHTDQSVMWDHKAQPEQDEWGHAPGERCESTHDTGTEIVRCYRVKGHTKDHRSGILVSSPRWAGDHA